jgi:GH24 family phage-related lysozyme (muramidase)
MVMRAIKLVLLKMTLNLGLNNFKQVTLTKSLLNQYITENYLKVERWLHRKHSSSKSEAKNEWRMLTDEQVFSFITDCES